MAGPPEETYVPYAQNRPPKTPEPPSEGQFSLQTLLIAVSVFALFLAAFQQWWLMGGLGCLAWTILGLSICYSAVTHRAEGWGWGPAFGLMISAPPVLLLIGGGLALVHAWLQ